MLLDTQMEMLEKRLDMLVWSSREVKTSDMLIRLRSSALGSI